MTYSLATMEVSKSTYDEIKGKLIDAGYDHAVLDYGNMLDMTHIGLVYKIPLDPAE